MNELELNSQTELNLRNTVECEQQATDDYAPRETIFIILKTKQSCTMHCLGIRTLVVKNHF